MRDRSDLKALEDLPIVTLGKDPYPCCSGFSRAFTLLELLAVMILIAILATMLLPLLSQIQNRIEKVGCMNNLRSLHVAANLYLQQNGKWPQIDPQLLKSTTHEYDVEWIQALTPFGGPRASWICPTVQRQLRGPDYTQPKFTRIDYLATPFDDKPNTPLKWSSQPWFVEKGDVHGNGNLLIFPDGSISELKNMRSF